MPKTPLIAVAVVVLSACQTKTNECNKLADIVNEFVAQMSKAEDRESDDPAEVAKDADAVADLSEKTASAIAALAIETPELQPRAQTYETVAKDMAEASREFATLMKKAHEVKSTRLPAAETKFTESQTALERVCDGGPPDCAKLAEVLERQPEPPNESELASVLGAYIADLETLALTDASVKQVVDEHVAAVKAYKDVIDEWAALQTDLDAADQKLDAVAKREDAIVADLNGYCVGSPT